MRNEKQEKNKMSNTESGFIDVIRGLSWNKADWLLTQLVILGIAVRTGMGASGVIIRVPEASVVATINLYNTPVGVINLNGDMDDDNIRISDLSNDHPFFMKPTPPALVHVEPTTLDGVKFDELPSEPRGPISLNMDFAQAEVAVMPANDFPRMDVTVEAEEPTAAVPSVLDPQQQEELKVGLSGIIEAPPVLAPSTPLIETNEPADPFAEESTEDDDIWDIDADAEVVEEHPELDYLKAEALLKFTDVQFEGITGTIRMYEVNSVNLSAIGIRINQKDQTLCTQYTQFKGGAQTYRYGPVTVKISQELLGEAVRVAEGRQEASVGSLFHNLIKVDADAGKIKCQRLTEGRWIDVPAKKDRVKEVKAKHDK
jgi:hypothetical protein